MSPYRILTLMIVSATLAYGCGGTETPTQQNDLDRGANKAHVFAQYHQCESSTEISTTPGLVFRYDTDFRGNIDWSKKALVANCKREWQSDEPAGCKEKTEGFYRRTITAVNELCHTPHEILE